MSRPLIVVRPEPGASDSVRAARVLGLDAKAFPLFETVAVAWHVAQPGRFDALILTSANAVRLGGAGLGALMLLPVHAVGDSTALAAREAGFTVRAVGQDGVEALVPSLAGCRNVLRLTGRDHRPLAPPGVEVETQVCYAAEPLAMPVPLVDALAVPSVIALHSARAAAHFVAEADRHGIARSMHRLACLAPRIAEAAGPGWDAVDFAATRCDQALLALAARMCQ